MRCQEKDLSLPKSDRGFLGSSFCAIHVKLSACTWFTYCLLPHSQCLHIGWVETRSSPVCSGKRRAGLFCLCLQAGSPLGLVRHAGCRPKVMVASERCFEFGPAAQGCQGSLKTWTQEGGGLLALTSHLHSFAHTFPRAFRKTLWGSLLNQRSPLWRAPCGNKIVINSIHAFGILNHRKKDNIHKKHMGAGFKGTQQDRPPCPARGPAGVCPQWPWLLAAQHLWRRELAAARLETPLNSRAWLPCHNTDRAPERRERPEAPWWPASLCPPAPAPSRATRQGWS